MFAPKVAKPQTKATASSTSNLAHQRSTLVARRPSYGSVQEALLLQRTIGNQAMLRLLAQRASNLIGNEPGGGYEQEAAPENMTKSAAASQSVQQVPELEHGRKTGPRLQANLRINAPGDIHEQEADRIAEQVLTKPMDPCVGATTRIQHHSEQATARMEAAPASVERVLASPGRPLEPTLRQNMERRFVHDFSRVRVHSGTEAEQSARDVNARAYTVGQSIVFGAGKFAPGTRAGQGLLAHELAHVVQQQSGAEANVVRRSNGFEDEPTLVERQSPHLPPFRGHVERGGEKIPGNVAKGEIVEKKPPGPTSGGGGLNLNISERLTNLGLQAIKTYVLIKLYKDNEAKQKADDELIRKEITAMIVARSDRVVDMWIDYTPVVYANIKIGTYLTDIQYVSMGVPESAVKYNASLLLDVEISRSPRTEYREIPLSTWTEGGVYTFGLITNTQAVPIPRDDALVRDTLKARIAEVDRQIAHAPSVGDTFSLQLYRTELAQKLAVFGAVAD